MMISHSDGAAVCGQRPNLKNIYGGRRPKSVKAVTWQGQGKEAFSEENSVSPESRDKVLRHPGCSITECPTQNEWERLLWGKKGATGPASGSMGSGAGRGLGRCVWGAWQPKKCLVHVLVLREPHTVSPLLATLAQLESCRMAVCDRKIAEA
jgi:hypothetical protein